MSIKLTLIDLHVTYVHITVCLHNVYDTLRQAWITERHDLESTTNVSARAPLLMDLVWAETSPCTVASQYLSSILGTTKFDNHPLAVIMGLTIKESGVQSPLVASARCTMVAAATQIKLHEDLHKRPPWKWAGIPDQRRPAADRDRLYTELKEADPKTLDKGLSAAIQSMILSEAEEHDGLVDDEFYKDLLLLWVVLSDGDTQDIERLHALLNRGLRRCENKQAATWPRVSSAAVCQQNTVAVRASQKYHGASRMKANEGGDHGCLTETKKCIASPLMWYFNQARARDKAIMGKAPPISKSYWDGIRHEWAEILSDDERSAIEGKVKADFRCAQLLPVVDAAPAPGGQCSLAKVDRGLLAAHTESAIVSAPRAYDVTLVSCADPSLRIGIASSDKITSFWYRKSGMELEEVQQDGNVVALDEKTCSFAIDDPSLTLVQAEAEWSKKMQVFAVDRGRVPEKLFQPLLRTEHAPMVQAMMNGIQADVAKEGRKQGRAGCFHKKAHVLETLLHFQGESSSMNVDAWHRFAFITADLGPNSAVRRTSTQMFLLCSASDCDMTSADLDDYVNIAGVCDVQLVFARLPHVQTFPEAHFGNMRVYCRQVTCGGLDIRDSEALSSEFGIADLVTCTVCEFLWTGFDEAKIVRGGKSRTWTCAEGDRDDADSDVGWRPKRRRPRPAGRCKGNQEYGFVFLDGQEEGEPTTLEGWLEEVMQMDEEGELATLDDVASPTQGNDDGEDQDLLDDCQDDPSDSDDVMDSFLGECSKMFDDHRLGFVADPSHFDTTRLQWKSDGCMHCVHEGGTVELLGTVKWVGLNSIKVVCGKHRDCGFILYGKHDWSLADSLIDRFVTISCCLDKHKPVAEDPLFAIVLFLFDLAVSLDLIMMIIDKMKLIKPF